MQPEWKDRIDHWIAALEKEFYEPLDIIPLQAAMTYDMLAPEEAEQLAFTPAPVGFAWGRAWEYGWFRGDIFLDERAAGKTIVMNLRTGGQATVFVNGEPFGTRRAEWVKEPHHYICDQILTQNGKPGEHFHLLFQAYGGHDYPESPLGSVSTGPVRQGDYEPRSILENRHIADETTFGIWHEDAYQLWLDASMLRDMLSVIEEGSLQAAEIEEALEKFTLIVDFEQPRAQRIHDYILARQVLQPVLSAKNGTSAPQMWAIGNAHLDLSWLWGYRETQRKVARTFAQQIRLMELYPQYKFLQSQPQSYLICKQLYPSLYQKIKEKIKSGQWIADGSMWVEPDTNMPSGESLIRQLVYGKRFYQEEFGIDTKLLWLPDTFGYSAALPQILKNCGVNYLTTQKIFWTYNGSDKFPYHHFTWKGMDGTEIVSFLHMRYESPMNASIIQGYWKNRVQKRNINKFLLPFGYGDGGGGPTRDHIEQALREKNLQGIPMVKMESPQAFFEACECDGAPSNKYTGELYFQCHRGTYTSQAAVKLGNRKSEFALRQAELWSTIMHDKIPYPSQILDACWKDVLLNQFHDILPGSSIACVYEEAALRYQHVFDETRRIIQNCTESISQGDGRTWFNSLSWDRNVLVKIENSYGIAHIPSLGWTSVIDKTIPTHPVCVVQKEDSVIMDNGIIKAQINEKGEVISITDSFGASRLSGPANVLRMYKDVPRKFDAWDIDSMYTMSPVTLNGDSQIEITESTPWKCTARIIRHFSNSTWTQQISLQSGKARIDFSTHVDWREKHRLLKVDFPTGIHAEEGINEIQFGYVKRPTHRSRPYDADRFEVCNHRYTALCDENRGAAVLNDCKYGVSMQEDTISLTLLRAATAPDLHADVGEHIFRYAYYVWDGPMISSSVVREGYEFNTAITSASGTASTFSFAQVDAPNIIVDTIKMAEDGSGDVILRLYECKHAATSAILSVQLPFSDAWICDMLENKKEALLSSNGRDLSLDFHCFEVKTIRIKKK